MVGENHVFVGPDGFVRVRVQDGMVYIGIERWGEDVNELALRPLDARFLAGGIQHNACKAEKFGSDA